MRRLTTIAAALAMLFTAPSAHAAYVQGYGTCPAPTGAAGEKWQEEHPFQGLDGYAHFCEQEEAREAQEHAKQAEEQAPIASLSVRSITQGYHESYEIPGVTRIVIEPSPASYAILTYTDSAHEHAVWRLLPGVTKAVCQHNEQVQGKLYGETCPTSLEYIQPSLNPPLDDPPSLEAGEPVKGAEVVIFWSCTKRIGQTISYTVTAQRGIGLPTTYTGRYKNAVTHKWCRVAKRKEERQRRHERARARKKREEHQRHEREKHEREIAAHRAEEERFERTCRAIGGIPVTVQSREGSWVIVCRSKTGGLLEVP
jgi:hypothetical protein